MEAYTDSLTFAGGSFALMPEPALRELVECAINIGSSRPGLHRTRVGEGGGAVDGYIDECKRLGFDIVEVSAGFITIPTDDLVRITEKAQKAGLKAKPEVGIQFGAGGATAKKGCRARGRKIRAGAFSRALFRGWGVYDHAGIERDRREGRSSPR